MFNFTEGITGNNSINWSMSKCSRISLPIFINDSVDFQDVIQGDIGSCWFLSCLISYLRPNAKNLEERISDIIKMVDIEKEYPNRKVYRVFLGNKKIFVDDYVPENYHNFKTLKCMWFILFEKAMLSLMTYNKNSNSGKLNGINLWVNNIDSKDGEMKAAAIGITYVVGGKSKFYGLHKSDNLPHINSLEIYNRFKKGEHILANTARLTYPGKKFPLQISVKNAGGIESHCYAILNIFFDKSKGTYFLTMCNPWGKHELGESKGEYYYPPDVEPGKGISIISWERFHYLFACVHVSE